MRLKLDADDFDLIYQVLANLGSGWYGAILIVPNYSDLDLQEKLLVLTGNIFFGTFTLIWARVAKKIAQKLRQNEQSRSN